HTRIPSTSVSQSDHRERHRVAAAICRADSPRHCTGHRSAGHRAIQSPSSIALLRRRWPSHQAPTFRSRHSSSSTRLLVHHPQLPNPPQMALLSCIVREVSL
ncbi:hypothetical protein EJB05_47177, partial [Eragrostis curvula]